MKTRICALLLSVAVAFSGIPATNVSANPATLETVVETIETEEETVVVESTEEMTTVEETTEAVTEEVTTEVETATEETTETELVVEETTTEEITTVEETTEMEETTVEEIATEEVTVVEPVTVEEVVLDGIGADVKAVGSNGKEYKDVAYLSLATVNALPVNAQAAYYEMCDNIAEMYDSGVELSNVVIAADDEAVRISYRTSINAVLEEAAENTAVIEENIELLNSSEVMEEEIDGVPFVQLDTLMLNEEFFKNQLNSYAKTLYDAGKNSIVKKGSNTISATYKGKVNLVYEPFDAISALINTYPNKFNWMDLGPNGRVEGTGVYYYASNKSVWKFKIIKSKHYSSSLEKKANAKVKELVNAAYEYAETNYPESPTYGIIKYFNDWICENNYYEYAGIYPEIYGTRAEYFYCHSCYGILLKGYGVCESYALAMTRLLDAAGIRNIYAVGDAGGGHAWNYVEMPNGQWYLLDSTWNDSENKATWDDYLLVKNDGIHKPEGRRFTAGNKFSYYTLASTDYVDASNEAVVMNASEVVLKPGAKYQLKIDAASNQTDYFNKYTKTWSSSNTSVAKVDKNGKVTAGKTAGSAVITCKVAGKEVSCTVYVYKFTGLKFGNNKASYTLDYANQDKNFTAADAQTVTLTVEQQNGVFNASTIASMESLAAPTAKSNKTSIVEVDSVSLSGDTIAVKVLPKALGTAKVTISFAGKKATLTVKVGQQMDASWFDFSKVVDVEYTGKAIKPAVALSDAGKAATPKPTYKVTYTNNTNAGTATVTVAGTGNYAGTITKNFTITPKDGSAATFTKCTASKTYNGAAQAPATTVKLGKTTLKAGRDYVVLYNGSAEVPTNVGVYTITIKTTGNYKEATIATVKNYEIKANKISKVKVTCPKNVKSGETPAYKVKIGTNDLPTSDYTVSYTDDKGNAVSSITAPGKYKLVITVQGTNVLPTGTKSSITKSFTVK